MTSRREDLEEMLVTNNTMNWPLKEVWEGDSDGEDDLSRGEQRSAFPWPIFVI